MNNISTGFGLCVLGLGIAAWPILDRLAPSANASAVTAAASAVSTAASGQTGPTIVWYGSTGNGLYYMLFRAWSDGRVEVRRVFSTANTCCDQWCQNTYVPCASDWFVVSDPNQGYSAASDLNFDSKVDGSDLGQLLAAWGGAPRQDIPPSDCPLALINP
jgi:hypothetical protein